MAETPRDLTNLLNEFDVARITRRSVSSVRTWRWVRQGGPRYIKIGASVRYRPEDLARWLESLPTGGSSLAAVALQAVRELHKQVKDLTEG